MSAADFLRSGVRLLRTKPTNQAVSTITTELEEGVRSQLTLLRGPGDTIVSEAAEAVVEHPRRSTTEELRKLMRVGRGHAELQRRYPERYGRPYRPPPTDGPSADGDVDPLKMSAKGIGWLSGAIRG